MHIANRARRRMPARWGIVAVLAAVALILPAGAFAHHKAGATSIQILNVSDWHGQLDPISVNGVNVGGAPALSTYFKQERATNPNSLTFTAGDAFGATPTLASLFDEVPAVKAQNLMGFDADTFGNHNFDRGVDHLQQMIDVADFQYVSANLRNRDAELEGVKDYELFEMPNGSTVAVIGITNPEAPTLVFPGRFASIEITDPVAAAQRARKAAEKDGADVFVVLTHMGVEGFVAGAPVGRLIDFANALQGFDLILGDHTDVQYEGVHNGALVTENRSKGVTYSVTTINLEPQGHKKFRVTGADAVFKTPVTSAVAPDQAIVDMLAPYRAQLSKVFDEKIGVATATFARGGNPAVERTQEVAIGNLITDAFIWRTGAQLAYTNGGGIRAPLPSSYAPADKSLRRPAAGYAAGPPYDLVIGDIYTVLPFGNLIVTRTLTGEQLYTMLEHSVSSMPSANGKFLQISGFKFTYSLSAPAGSRVTSVALSNGTPIAKDGTSYTVATNDFTNAGGDGYPVFPGTVVTGEIMADVLLQYVKHLGTITPTTEGRIVQQP